MKRLIFPLILVAAMACGGESTPVGDAMEGAKNDVAAAGGSTTAVEEAGPPATEAMEDSTASDNTIAQSCMDLVADGKFSEAVPVCTEALGLEPANAEIQQALDSAKAGVAKAALDDPAATAGKMLQ